MKHFDLVDRMIKDRFVRMYLYENCISVIVHVGDSVNSSGDVLQAYCTAHTCGFVELVRTHNNNQDYEFKLTDEGDAYIRFKLL